MSYMEGENSFGRLIWQWQLTMNGGNNHTQLMKTPQNNKGYVSKYFYSVSYLIVQMVKQPNPKQIWNELMKTNFSNCISKTMLHQLGTLNLKNYTKGNHLNMAEANNNNKSRNKSTEFPEEWVVRNLQLSQGEGKRGEQLLKYKHRHLYCPYPSVKKEQLALEEMLD